MSIKTQIKKVDFEVFIKKPTPEAMADLERYLGYLGQDMDSYTITKRGELVVVEICGVYYSIYDHIVNDMQGIFQ